MIINPSPHVSTAGTASVIHLRLVYALYEIAATLEAPCGVAQCHSKTAFPAPGLTFPGGIVLL